MKAPNSLVAGAVEILNTAAPDRKVSLTRRLAAAWRSGSLDIAGEATVAAPDRPARPARPVLLAPREMPKRGVAGVKGRRALLHALAHIELNAIDLAWDLIARFCGVLPPDLPRPAVCDFFHDWVGVADDEARHFSMLAERLAALESHYGDLPAHDGLWAAAFETRGDILARLAVVPLVLEARGLDVTPATIRRLRHQDLSEDADTLEAIYRDEIVHVGAGVKWFNAIADARKLPRAGTFQNLVRGYFKGRVQGPFNLEARQQAGFPPEYYENLDAGGAKDAN